MRCFVGLWPDATAVAAVAALGRPASPGLRWTSPDSWHVTLRFLGEVADADAAPDGPLVTALRDALAGERCTPVALGPATARFEPKILYVPATGAERLAAVVGAATAGFGDAPVEVAFIGHLTIARCRPALPPGLVGAPISATWTASSIAVVASERRPDGARYRSIATVPLPR